jgi:Undecaprenyl-phosphate glucose phosphotransferase
MADASSLDRHEHHDLRHKEISNQIGHSRAFSAVAHESVNENEAATKKWFGPASERVLLDLVRIFDLLLLVFVSYAAYHLYQPNSSPNRYIAATMVGILLWVTIAGSLRLYTFGELRGMRGLQKLTMAWSAVILTLLTLAFAFHQSNAFSRAWIGIWFAGGLVALAISHFIAAGHIAFLIQNGVLLRKIVVLGAGGLGRQVIEHVKKCRKIGYRLSGVFEDRASRISDGLEPIGRFEDAISYIRENGVDCAIIALPLSAADRISCLVDRLREVPVDVFLTFDAIGFSLPLRKAPTLEGLPVLPVVERPIKDWRSVIKAVEDKAVAALAIVLLAPLLIGIAIAIKLDSKGSVLFCQPRLGFNNREFRLYKFRTMRSDATDLLGDRLVRRGDDRLTRFGAVLRAWSLDELPQLFNVLIGQMSIVGPRPHALNAKAADRPYDELVAQYAARHRVKPGITGWAQVNGWRGETDTYEKLLKRIEYDLAYIDNWSIRFDLWVLLLTLVKGFRHPNAY